MRIRKSYVPSYRARRPGTKLPALASLSEALQAALRELLQKPAVVRQKPFQSPQRLAEASRKLCRLGLIEERTIAGFYRIKAATLAMAVDAGWIGREAIS
jgi:hypothetical protein